MLTEIVSYITEFFTPKPSKVLIVKRYLARDLSLVLNLGLVLSLNMKIVTNRLHIFQIKGTIMILVKYFCNSLALCFTWSILQSAHSRGHLMQTYLTVTEKKRKKTWEQ